MVDWGRKPDWMKNQIGEIGIGIVKIGTGRLESLHMYGRLEFRWKACLRKTRICRTSRLGLG